MDSRIAPPPELYHYTTWRLHTRPIPVVDWLRVEVLTEIAPRAVWQSLTAYEVMR